MEECYNERVLYTTLLLHPIHILFAFYYGVEIIAYLGILLYATSIIYWKNPHNDSYRMFDCIIARLSILTLIILSICIKNNRWIFTTLSLLLAGIVCWYISCYCYDTKKYLFSINFHCILHIFVSIAALIVSREYYLSNIRYQYIPASSYDQSISTTPLVDKFTDYNF